MAQSKGKNAKKIRDLSEVEIVRDRDSIILTPKRQSWSSFSTVEKAEDDFMTYRPDILEKGRVLLWKNTC